MPVIVTAEMARRLFDYVDGTLIWKCRPLSDFATLRACSIWNAKYPGTQAGYIMKNGYRHISLHGKSFRTSRLIWLREHGYWPECIDHIDGNRANEVLGNLRDVTQAENNKNRARQKNAKFGTQGIERSGRKWRADIGHNSHRIYLGTFETFAGAAEARRRAEAELGFHANHGRPGALAAKIQARKARLK